MKHSFLKHTALAAAAVAVLTAGASAAWSDFADGDAIVNRAAVDALTGRGILSGRADNTFDPGGITRRDEMAKMISTLLDPQAAASGRYDGEAAALMDISGSWAVPYIGHCYSLGIISGKGDGRFDPAGTVTGTETAVMLIGALGVDTSSIGGPSWAAQVNELAGALGIYEGFTADPAAPLTRDGAALLLYNTLDHLDAPRVMDLRAYAVRPQGLAAARGGKLVFTDSQYGTVLQTTDGVSAPEVLAGGNGPGYVDGDAEESAFASPWGIAPFLDGWAVSDPENNAIRLLRDGKVRTMDTVSVVKLSYPTGLAAGEDGCLYIADTHSGKVYRVSEDGKAEVAAKGLSEPMGLCYADGVLYIAETGAHRVSMLKDGKVTVLAGSGKEGLADGAGTAAAFSLPQGVVADEDGTVYVSDTGNSAIRRIRNGVVDTFYARQTEEMFPSSPRGMVIMDGTLYVADGFAGAIILFQL